jgi:hypothetical protein
MDRADFWCRVLGWIQLLAGAAAAICIIFLWELLKELFMIDSVPALSFLVWVFVLIAALPEFLAGLFTILFANAVEQARLGLRGEQKMVLRILMAISGLWSAGIVGFAGFGFPPLGLLGILALATVIVAIMGPDWTADLFKRNEAET